MRRSGGLIDQIKKELITKGMPQKQREARTWLASKVPALTTQYTPKGIVQYSPGRYSSPQIGRMYFYFYDAKWKDELPYWDKFPLMMPIEFYNDGWLGLNFHYLDYDTRATLLDNLMYYRSNNRLDETTYLRVSYNVLGSIKQYEAAKPCIKRYLSGYVKSNLVEIYSDEWLMASFLPVEQFQKKSKYYVWNRSAGSF